MIRAELDNYVNDRLQLPLGTVMLGNIAMMESEGNNIDLLNKAVITLVNIEEESTLKNAPHYRVINGNTRYENPPVVLNLYVLFTANFPTQYGNALEVLSTILEFFQGQTHFNLLNSPAFASSFPDLKEPQIVDLKLIADLYTMTFEQINHLWGSLGGKQIPFAMYKMRLVKIQAEKVLQEGGPISEIVTNNKAV
ncbi:MAG: DUF4255 domain-containing protein [Saprospiraceae bacterium]